MAFNIISTLVILLLIINFFSQAKKNHIKFFSVINNVKSDLLRRITGFKGINIKDNNLFNFVRDFLFSFSIILFFLMAVSGFLLAIFWQKMDGFLLFIHVLVSPFFVIAVTLGILVFANNLQFNSEDYKYITERSKPAKQKMEYWKKIYFWLFTTALILNIGSVVLAMYPVFGTSGQNELLNIHRYSALALLVFTINFLIFKYSHKKSNKEF